VDRVPDQTAARHRTLGLREFGHVDEPNAQTTAAKPGRSPRVGGWVDDLGSDTKGIGRVRFQRIDLDAVAGRERIGVDPLLLNQQQSVADLGHSGLEMQTPRDPNRTDLVAVRSEARAELRDSRGVRPPRGPDVEGSADAQDVAPVESTGRLDSERRQAKAEESIDRIDLLAAGGRAGASDHSQFIDEYGRVFDENGVWERGIRGEFVNSAPEVTQHTDVRTMLPLRSLDIDRLARNMRQLARTDPRADSANERRLHE
jgi:hypothetical protein